MTVSETLTALMDKTRKITGLTEEISVGRLTSLMDHFDLHVNPNLLSQTSFSTGGPGMWANWNTQTTGLKLNPGTYTVSWQVKSSGTFKHIRIRLYDLTNATTANHIVGPFKGKVFPLTDKRQTYTFTLPADFSYDVCFYSADVDNGEEADAATTFYNVKLECGDLATPLTTVRGS